VTTTRVSPFRWLARHVVPVLIGAVLAIAIVVAGALLVLHFAFGDSSKYCTDSVRSHLAGLLGEVAAPSGSTAHTGQSGGCDDSSDFAYSSTRVFGTNGGRVETVLTSLQGELEASGWSQRPRRQIDAEALYLRRSDGKPYWAELSTSTSAVFLIISTPGPA
jgi:hypothetical protein